MVEAPFFLPRSERLILDTVLTSFPFPLAPTYARLQDELDSQEAVAAVWQLRDAFECVLKFVACLAVADCLASTPQPEVAHAVVSALLDPKGISLGVWHGLLEDALLPLGEPGDPAATGRCLPDLYALFFDQQGKRSELNKRINGDADSLVPWRNRVFGHGVFWRDWREYAREVDIWLPRLEAWYRALEPVLACRRLESFGDADEALVWHGVRPHPTAAPHLHLPAGDPLPLWLVGRDADHPRRLSLAPLLTVQQCAMCGEMTTFFFDKSTQKNHALRFWSLD